MTERKPDRAIDDRLLDVAIEQFGEKGLEGASTRAIAAAAGTAMSSITYHFGGKDGLHVAAARHIAKRIGDKLQGPLAESMRLAQAPGRDGAVAALLVVLDGFVDVMTNPESAPWARFIVREQMAPTAAFDVLYTEMIAGIASHASGLILRAADGRISEAEAHVKALAMFGQILVFRVARATVLAITGWNDITDPETEQIRATVRAHSLAILQSLRGDAA